MHANELKQTPCVCTVILNWNQPAITLDCAKNALAQRVCGGHSVLVIDNGSTPENRQILTDNFPTGCEFIQNDLNLGFAGGMNVGISYALERGCKYIWLLNNDAFPEPECLNALVSTMDENIQLGAVTPKLIYPNGSPQLFGGRVNWDNGELTFLMSGEIPIPTPYGFYATGAALFIRSEALDEINGFDEKFFAYWEEVDLCLQMVRHGAWNFAVVSNAVCVHYEKQSTSGPQSVLPVHLLTRNCFILLRKHLPLRWLIPAYFRACAAALERAGALAETKPAISKAIIAGVYAALTRQHGFPKQSAAPNWFEKLALKRWWGISRLLQRCATWIAPRQRWTPKRSSSQTAKMTRQFKERF